MSKKNGQKVDIGSGLGSFVRNNTVPIMFVLICAVCIPLSGFSTGYLLDEIVTRMGRNIFLILCLLIPILAGMGLNFGMTLGAMAGEIGLERLVTHRFPLEDLQPALETALDRTQNTIKVLLKP